MNILLTFNDAYAPHAASVITGLLNNCKEDLSVYVFYRNLSDETIKKFQVFYKDRLKLFEFYKIEFPEALYESIKKIEEKKKGYLKDKLEVYLRLFASSLIKEDGVLYLDCDIVVNGDISDIYNYIDEEKYIYAVKEYDPNYKFRRFSHIDEFQMPSNLYSLMIRDAFFTRMKKYHKMKVESPYFCAGVMYLNLKKMRNDNFFDVVLRKVQNESNFVFADQDILNSIIDGDFGVLPPKWNSFVLSYGLMLNYTTKELQEAQINPIIVHMPGVNKPWYKKSNGKFHRLYWKYRQDTPWPDYYKYPFYYKVKDYYIRVHNAVLWRISKLANLLRIERKITDGLDMLDSYCN